MIHDSVDDSSLHCIASWLCCQWLKSPAAYLLYGFIVKLGAAAPHTHTSLDLFINLRLEEPKPISLFFFILKSRVWFRSVIYLFLCAWKRFRFSLLFYFILFFVTVMLGCVYTVTLQRRLASTTPGKHGPRRRVRGLNPGIRREQVSRFWRLVSCGGGDT